ncbi:hypothetical protein GJ496_004814 [Pomphorhynchus laevis]|nr:hypothetical protein GJ496_004814 [Pomphorhynchus laevis]
MGKEKGGFLTPKAISNRIKAKGLQKLRWYCQMCQKQCRDENGFKCHTMSESHQRQLLLVAENPGKFIHEFSQEFHASYMDFLRRVYGGRRVEANAVYQEYIKDRNHVHMNGTRWTTLSGYVQWLGHEGICIVDQTEKGWFVQAIDKDPQTILNNEKQRKKQKMQSSDNDKDIIFLQKQINRCKEMEKQKQSFKDTEIAENQQLPEQREVVKFPISLGKKENTKALNPLELKMPSLLQSSHRDQFGNESSNKRKSDKLSALEEIILEEKLKKRSWILEGIIVKVIQSKLKDLKEGSKATVVNVDEFHQADLKCTNGCIVCGVSADYLRTVIPAIGRHVVILSGNNRGKKAELLCIDEACYCVDVKLTNGHVLRGLQYSDVSKSAEQQKI